VGQHRILGLRTGMSQSPVNTDLPEVGVLHGPPLLLRYRVSELAVENTGHTVEVMIPAGRDRYPADRRRPLLTQYPFHAPAEHTTNGHQADVEAHFVHSNAWAPPRSSAPCTASAPNQTHCWTEYGLLTAKVCAHDGVKFVQRNRG